MTLLAATRNALPLLLRLVRAQGAVIDLKHGSRLMGVEAVYAEYEAARRACEEAP